MTPEDLRSATAFEGARLLAVATDAPTAPVPACPGWDATALLDHVAGVLGFVTSVVVPRVQAPPKVRPLPRPDGADPVGFAAEALEALLLALDGLEPHEPVWNWSAGTPDTGAFWLRRMPHELLVHRIDLEQAVDRPTRVSPDLAADGVDEMLAVFLPRVQARAPFRRLVGSLRLERSDGPQSWAVRIEPTSCAVQGPPAPAGPADVRVRGTAEQLLLALWGRTGWTDLEVEGDADLLAAWSQEMPA